MALIKLHGTIGGIRWQCDACQVVFVVQTDDNATPGFCAFCGVPGDVPNLTKKEKR